MFYETERIINKQNKYIKRKANDVINSFDGKDLSTKEVLACIDVMLTEDNNETKVDILNLARKIVLSNQEKENEQSPTTQLSFANRLF
jgi:hypothetical protein